MIVSKKALCKIIPELKNVSDEQIAKAFNNSGCEVERVIHHEQVNNLVIGKIIGLEKHPNANKLNVCQVQLDVNGTTHTIVCGATNLQVNKYVIVALQGAKMVDGRVIEYKELRGILSQGMICAYSELTSFVDYLSPVEATNIILLDDAKIGDTDVFKYINLDDTIYDLSLPSNRNDLNSIYSICQELSGYFGFNYQNTLPVNNTPNTNKLEVTLDSTCKGLLLLKLKVNSITESDWQIKSYLMNNGIVPINNLLDELALISLFNNVSIVVYDYDKVGLSVNVGLSNTNVKAKLNNKELQISKEDLVVSNKNNPVGLAGVAAFDEYKPDNNTKNFLVEIGNYDFRFVRASMVRHDLYLDSGRRLSKPLSNWYIEKSLSQFKNAEIVYKNLKFEESKVVPVDFADANKFLGVNVSKEEITSKLTQYGYSFKDDKIIVPPYRLDIEIWQDIYEEILKVVDINKASGISVNLSPILNNQNIEYNKINEVKKLMNENYFTEVKSYNLVNKSSLDTFNIFNIKDYMKIANPLNSNHEYWRTNLIESLLEIYKYNISYKNKIQPIFEIQKIYTQNNIEWNLTCISEQSINLDKVNKINLFYNVSSLKSIINSLAKIFNIEFSYFPAKESNIYYQQETLSIYCSGQLVGYVGRIRNSCLKSYSLDNKPIYFITINLNLLFKLYKPQDIHVQYASKLPTVYKDISYVSTLNIDTMQVLESLQKLPFISSYEYIDLFKIDENKYSYTLRVYFKNDKVYSSEEIDLMMKELQHLLITLHCEIRK